ncbi:MAG TPA: DUF3883 domain-containing protein [Thermoleophilaceae bacterium]
MGVVESVGGGPSRTRTAAERKAIGDAGESLTVRFEQERLRSDGRPDLAREVRWIAQESDAYGFDVLSYRGARHGGAPDEELAIEVKSSTLPLSSRFHFFLTGHEWKIATQLDERYVFYFWPGVDPGPPARSRQREPIMATGETVAVHLPGGPPCGEECAWTAASVYLSAAA